MNVRIETPQESGILAEAIRREILRHEDPGYAKAALGGLIGNIIGPISNDFWQRMWMDSHEPCDIPSCDCHTVSGRVFDALDDLRGDWINRT